MTDLDEICRDFGFSPNDNQRKAILHVDGPLFLPAGPGSGKTRVLLWRTLNLIVFHQVKPEEIFLSTFTEKAAHQLREGLRTLLAAASNYTGRPYDTAKLYVGTVHSLCQRLLSDRRFYPDRQRQRVPVLLDELDQYLHISRRRLWNSLIAEAGFGEEAPSEINGWFDPSHPSQSRHAALTNCLSLFNRLSEECLEPARCLETVLDPTFRKLLLLYDAYRRSLVTDQFQATDFALLQQHALHLVSSSTASAAAFRHVIVDEYQDTNTVQERLFFGLAANHRNICVVGDDDQALYRFRGATVENFVEFPSRCRKYLDCDPEHVPLVTNYRSREPLVNFSGQFLSQCDWRKAPPLAGDYRVTSKQITAARKEVGVAVVASTAGRSEAVAEEIAAFVKQLLDTKRVGDPNQVAFLYPSLKYRGQINAHVERMMGALERHGLKAYAPRARTFVEGDEATAMLGLFSQVFGRLTRSALPGLDYKRFHDWLDRAESVGQGLLAVDPMLQHFVNDRARELAEARDDYARLSTFVSKQGWELAAQYKSREMKRPLGLVPGLSDHARRTLNHPFLDQVVRRREEEGRPLPLDYILKRATSIDWSLLDLFYRLSGFEPFLSMFGSAQRPDDPDEGPVANLGLLSQYLSRFMDQRAPILTGALLQDNGFLKLFFGSYLYALYRRGESEYEDADDPFPKGRIPFLTIHQAKGLEFPVVVLGNLRKDDNGPQFVEQVVRPLLPSDRDGEPLARLAKFDIMRMYYVGLSRAQHLLVLADMKGQGLRINAEFRALLNPQFPRLKDLDISSVPIAGPISEQGPRSYSYTSDYLAYQRCARQYLIFRQFDFAPSRSQTLLFGSLVHRTLDDLHQYLISRRSAHADDGTPEAMLT